MSSPGPSPRHDASGSGASEEGLFFGSGDEEDFRVEDEVSNEESDAYVLDASDDERESDGESEGSPPLLDASLHEPNADKADLLHLVYVAASSEDMSKAGMYTWKTQYITGRNAQLPAAPLDESPAVPTDTAEAIRLNFEGLLFLMLPKSMWIKIAEESNDYQLWQRNMSPGQLAEWSRQRRARNPAYHPKCPAQRQKEMSMVKAISLP